MTAILKEGRNCWCTPKASRGAFLVDADAYFRSLKQALLKAERQVLIAGWDIDSRINLDREEKVSGGPGRLVDLLRHVTRKRRDLDVYILLWDYVALYALEREILPRISIDWRSPRSIHLCLDSSGPTGIAHHQKTVVIDDRVAFCGGIDITENRWDTPEHEPDDPRRVNWNGRPHEPFHDVQMLVEGDIAARLGDDFRDRWQIAAGRAIEPPGDVGGNSGWPDDVRENFSQTPVAIARTIPRGARHSEIREVEQLYCDSIAAAEDLIYIENQYLTSMLVCEALAVRLEEDYGPEVVIVTPDQNMGWLEEQVMGAGRTRFVDRLRRADVHDRLRVCGVRLAGPEGKRLNVHAKVMVIDDRFARIGSSNLNNRSMGFDTECDLALEAAPDDERLRRSIAAFRNRLLCEHLAVDAGTLNAERQRAGSWCRAVDGLMRDNGRSLTTITIEDADDLPDALRVLADPERPIELNEFVDSYVMPRLSHDTDGWLRKVAPFLVALLLVVALVAGWSLTPLADTLDVQVVVDWLGQMRDHTLAPLVVLVAYLLAGAAAFPITVMIAATGMVFGGWLGLAYAMVGATLSALVMYFAGNLVGRRALDRVDGTIVRRLRRRLGRRGLTSVVVLRLVPVAPFTVINLVAGASGVGLRDFTVGTMMGLAPGCVVMTVFGSSLSSLLSDPGPVNVAVAAAAVVAWGLLLTIAVLLDRRKDGS